MDPVTASLVMGGAGMVGSYLTGQSNAKAASDAADKQIYWQDKWRKDQYQTTVKDLEAAGLNPNLAYQNGGAGTPSGSAMYAEKDNPLEQLGGSAIQYASMKKDLEKKQGEIDLAGQMAATQKTQQALNASSAKAAEATAAKSMTEKQLMDIKKPAIQTESELQQKENQLRNKTLYIDYGAEKLNQAMGLYNSAKSINIKSVPIPRRK